jgi:protein involved in polysaccharide export with SLBB domain
MYSAEPFPGSYISTISRWTAVFILFVACGSVYAQEPEIRPAELDRTVKQEDLVHFGDLIDVDVLGGFEFDWRGTITPDGFLDGIVVYGEPIRALCRSEQDIAADIARAHSKILRDPQVVVKIIDRSNRALARVLGAVRTPTRFSIRRPVTLKELLVLSGGIAGGASGEITILRPRNLGCTETPVPSDNGSELTNIKISDLLSGKAESNPVILSGDIVTVSKALPIYVIGAVGGPMPLYLTSKLTVSRAVAMAGGLAKDGDASTVTIFRRSGAQSTQIELDLAKVKRGEIEDEILKPFDIIEVPAKGGGKRKYPPASPVNDNRDPAMGELPLKIVD